MILYHHLLASLILMAPPLLVRFGRPLGSMAHRRRNLIARWGGGKVMQ